MSSTTFPRVTVSFYMDETEVSNLLPRVPLLDHTHLRYRLSEIIDNALPDTLVWREELAYNEPYVEYYFRYPSYDEYPVVGISWLQANEFCRWRSDRVNEAIMADKAIWTSTSTLTTKTTSLPNLIMPVFYTTGGEERGERL